jgi:hypothetical protein
MTTPSHVILGGASETHARHGADFYPTPPECTEALVRAFPSLFQGVHLWEPACGDGAISDVLSRRATVLSTDLHVRGYGTGGVDFLTASLPNDVQGIVTNPPFDLAGDFIEHACSMGVPVAMLVKATYWHAKGRIGLFRRTGPLAVCPLTWRPRFCPERGKAPTMDFIWTVWGPTPAPSPSYVLLEKT